MTVTIDGLLGITTPALTSTVVTTDELNLNGTFNFTGSFVLDGSLVFKNPFNSNLVTLTSGPTITDWTFTLPIDSGSAGQVLVTDGNGNTSWQTGLGTGTVNPGLINQLAFYAATGDTVSANYNLSIYGGALTLGVPGGSAGSITFSGSTSQDLTIAVRPTAGNWTLTLPNTPGNVGDALITDGTGITTWATFPSGNVDPGFINQLAYYSLSGTTVMGNPYATITNGSLALGSVGLVEGSTVLYGSTSGFITVKPPAVAGTWTLTLPNNDGTNGQALVTDGSGNTSWAAVGGSGTVSTGNITELAYYSATGIVVSGNGNVRASNGDLTLGVAGTTGGSVVLSGATSGTTTIAPSSAAGNWTLTLPTGSGVNGQALVTDGSGNATWSNVGGSGTVNLGSAGQLAFYTLTGTVVDGNPNVTISNGSLTLGTIGATAGELLLSGSSSGRVTINAAAAAGTWTLTLPTNDGANGQVLTTDGNGVTSWVALPSPSLIVNTTTISSGTSGRILYDNAGTMGEKTVSGSGDVVLATSPTVTTPVITGLNETKTAPTISTGILILDCSVGNVFSVSLNANITTLTFSNVPSSGTSYSLTLSFTADGTPRTITWGASVKWPNGTAPTLTSTNGKVDTFILYTFNAGVTWFAFTAGQNS